MTAMVQTHPLISIRPDATVHAAAELMNDCNIAALGLFDAEKRFTGILTERDITAFVSRGEDPTTSLVGEIGNDFPVVVTGPLSDADAIEWMRSAHIRHLIVREDGEFRIVSMRDFLAPSHLEDHVVDVVASDLMTSPALACRASAFFEEIAESLADGDISGMPVVDDHGRLIGVISERDLAHALGGPLVKLAVRRHSKGPFARDLADIPRDSRRVKDIMTTQVISASPDAPARELAALIVANKIRRIPIVRDSELIGVVTRGDLLAHFAGVPRKPCHADDPVVVGTDAVSPRPSFDWGPHGDTHESGRPSSSRPEVHNMG